MLVKFGSLVTTGSGSLGGHTIQHSKGGMQLRTKPICRRPPSASQYAIRSINLQLQAGWQALTDSQRNIWTRYAQDYGIMNAKGDKRPLSGHDLWMKYQFKRCFFNAPFMVSPYLFNSEFLKNGFFDLGTIFWSVYLDMSFSVYNRIASISKGSIPFLFCYQPISVISGIPLGVTFELVSNPDFSSIIVGTCTPSFGDAGYAIIPSCKPGRYYLSFTPLANAYAFYFQVNPPSAGTVYKFSKFSLFDLS